MQEQTLQAKKAVVSEIREKLDKAGAVVLVDARGLTVAEDTVLRKTLREAGVDYKTYKNTMINFAVQGTPYEPLAKHLEGPTTVAISYEDATAAGRELNTFVEKYEHLSFKAGVIDGTYYDEEMIQVMAKIPSREVLLSRLLGSFKAPIASFARVVNEIAKAQGGGKDAAEEAAE